MQLAETTPLTRIYCIERKGPTKQYSLTLPARTCILVDMKVGIRLEQYKDRPLMVVDLDPHTTVGEIRELVKSKLPWPTNDLMDLPYHFHNFEPDGRPASAMHLGGIIQDDKATLAQIGVHDAGELGFLYWPPCGVG